MKVFRFSFNIKVYDGFDCDVIKNELRILLEDMENTLLDYSYKADDYNLPLSAPVSMKCFDTLKFYAEGVEIDSRTVAKKLRKLEKKLDTFKIYGGSYQTK